MKQAQNIVLRYLETLPAQDTVDLETMSKNISRHYPFHNAGTEFFRQAVDALEKAGWVKTDGDELGLDKVARVTARYLMASVRKVR